jgi:hypothetical protein
MAAVARLVLFLQITCKECRALFFICRSCYRGHCYCGDTCRDNARRRQLQEANRRYQQSKEGRLDHNDRQHAYLERKAQAQFLTDQSSQPQSVCGSLVAVESGSPLATQQGSHLLERTGCGMVVCIVCGRSGRFINPFHPTG